MQNIQYALMKKKLISCEKYNIMCKILDRIKIIDNQLDYQYKKNNYHRIENLEQQKRILNNA